jgi:hypothetical protein
MDRSNGVVKTVLFIRDFRRLSGGHLKLFHYVEHVLRSGFAQPKVLLASESVRDSSNIFLTHPELLLDAPVPHDLLFLGGVDWPTAESFGLLQPTTPVLNLLQGTMHGNLDDPWRPWLSHTAIRICGSEEIRQAIEATALAKGPIYTVTHGIDPLDHRRRDPSQRTVDVVLAGSKDPDLARAISERLARTAVSFDILIDHLPREVYLDRISRARIAILLPLRQEGSFILALEAMALDVPVVSVAVPGVRTFCRHQETALLLDRDAATLAEAALWLLANQDMAARLRAGGREMVAIHTLENERAAFLPILAQALAL